MNYLQIHIGVQQSAVNPCEQLLLSLGASGITLDDAKDQALLEPLPGETPLWNDVIVTGIFPQDEQAPYDAKALCQFIAFQLELEADDIYFDVVEDQAWERAWMDHYQPIQISQRVWIVPQWLDAPDGGAINIRLDPGLAFGTGNHASTFLCLEWLAQFDLADKVVIDYGCGSGILGVAALLLGARQVFATDIDPQAIRATLQNAELNQVAQRLWVGQPDDFQASYATYRQQHGAAQVLVANILAQPLMQLAPSFYDLTAPKADIVLAGLITEQVEEVQAAYAPYFTLNKCEMREQNWCRLSGQRLSK